MLNNIFQQREIQNPDNLININFYNLRNKTYTFKCAINLVDVFLLGKHVINRVTEEGSLYQVQSLCVLAL